MCLPMKEEGNDFFFSKYEVCLKRNIEAMYTNEGEMKRQFSSKYELCLKIWIQTGAVFTNESGIKRQFSSKYDVSLNKCIDTEAVFTKKETNKKMRRVLQNTECVKKFMFATGFYMTEINTG